MFNNKRYIKIFIASTFIDLQEERNYLIENVYPKLKEYCKNKYGLDFQIVDRRYGFAGEDTENKINSILNEVDYCIEESAGPCFIALLGDRYGARILPACLLQEKFDLMKPLVEKYILDNLSDDVLKQDKNRRIFYSKTEGSVTFKSYNIFDSCYKLNTNEIPARYYILPSKQIFKGYTKHQNEFDKIWKDLKGRLMMAFQHAADICFENKDEEFRSHFYVSITEEEIYHGILCEKQRPIAKDKCLVFIRNIEGENSSIKGSESILKKYFEEEEENKELLKTLKSDKIPAVLPENIIKYKVKWDSHKGILLEKNEDEFKEFGRLFFDKLKELIDKSQNKINRLPQNINRQAATIMEEMNNQEEFLQHYELFLGNDRDDQLTTILSYILSDEDTPIVICGGPGCGKTSLIARSIKLLNQQDFNISKVIYRFLGTTPQSTTVASIYKTILYELEHHFDMPITNCDNFSFTKFDLKKLLTKKLYEICERRDDAKIVIFLDALEHLDENEYADLNWILSSYPKNFKFIYSCRTNYENILTKMEKIIRFEKIEVGGFSLDTAKEYIDILLKNNNRKLSESQNELLNKNLENGFKENRLYPLYVKLLFDIFSRMYSFNDELVEDINVDDKKTEFKSTHDCIEHFFKKLHFEFGDVFAKCLIYINCSKTGISDVELEDALSINDECLYKLFEFHEPPIRHFPLELWSRIKFKIKEYFVEKTVDNTTVFTWYHREFNEVAHSMFAPKTVSGIDQYYIDLIDIHCETWNNEPKPFKRNPVLIKAYKERDIILKENDTAKRYTSKQPFIFESGIVNDRTLNCIIQYITQIKDDSLRIKLAIDRIYLNFDLMLVNGVKNIELSFQAKINNLNNFKIDSSSHITDKETYFKHIYDFGFYNFTTMVCNSNIYELNNYPNARSLLLSSYYLWFYGKDDLITAFIEKCDQASIENCKLVVPYANQIMSFKGCASIESRKKEYVSCACVFTTSWSTYVVTCRDKIYIYKLNILLSLEQELFNEIDLPYNDDQTDAFNTIKPYLLMSDVDRNTNLEGGFILSSKHILCSTDFNDKVFLQENYSETIANMEFIDPYCFILRFENSFFCEIKQIRPDNKEVDQKIDFNGKSLCIAVYAEWMKMYNYPCLEFNSGCYLAVCLENYQVLIYFRETNEKLFSLINTLNFTCQASACMFNKQLLEAKKNILLLTVHDDSTCNFIYIHKIKTIKIKDKKSCLDKYKIHCFENDIAIIGDENKLYVLDSTKNKCICINGDYDGAEHILTQRNIIVCAYKKRCIDYYYIDRLYESEDSNYKIAHLINQFKPRNVLCVTDIFHSKSVLPLLLTVIDNGQVDIEFLNFLLVVNNLPFDIFNRSEDQIDSIANLGNDIIVSHSFSSSEICLWNPSNGEIVNKIQNENSMTISTREIIICKGIIFIIRVQLNDKLEKSLVVEILEKNDALNAVGSHIIHNNLNYCLTSNFNENRITIASKHDNTIFIDVVSQKNSNSTSIDLKMWFGIEQITSYAVTSLNEYLFIISDKTLSWINFQDKKLLVQKTIEEFGEKPYDVRIVIVEDSDEIVILWNNIGIFYSNIDEMTEIFYKRFDKIKVTKFEAKKHILCLNDESCNKLYIINLKYSQMLQQLFVQDELILDNMTPSNLHFCISENCEYLGLTVEGILSLYSLKSKEKCERIAQIPLFEEVTSITITDFYVCLSIKDKRVISYLIASCPKSIELLKTIRNKQFNQPVKEIDLFYLLSGTSISWNSFAFFDVQLDTNNASVTENFLERIIDNLKTIELSDKIEINFVEKLQILIKEFSRLRTETSNEYLTTPESKEDQILNLSGKNNLLKSFYELEDIVKLSTLRIKKIKEHAVENIRKKTRVVEFKNIEVLEETRYHNFGIKLYLPSFEYIQAIDKLTKNGYDVLIQQTYYSIQSSTWLITQFKRLPKRTKKEFQSSYEIDMQISKIFNDLIKTIKIDFIREIFEDFELQLLLKLLELQNKISSCPHNTSDDLKELKHLLETFYKELNVEDDIHTRIKSYTNQFICPMENSDDLEFENCLLQIVEKLDSNVDFHEISGFFSEKGKFNKIENIQTTFTRRTHNLLTFYSSTNLLYPLILTNITKISSRTKDLIKERYEERNNENIWQYIYINDWMINEYESTDIKQEFLCKYGNILENGKGNEPPIDTRRLFEDITSKHVEQDVFQLELKTIFDCEELVTRINSYKDEYCALTPIHYAAALGRNDIIIWLYLNKHNIKCADSIGATPLYYAMLNGQIKTVILLKLLGLDGLFIDKCNFILGHMEVFEKFAFPGIYKFRINAFIQQLINGIEIMEYASKILEDALNKNERLRNFKSQLDLHSN